MFESRDRIKVGSSFALHRVQSRRFKGLKSVYPSVYPTAHPKN